MPSEVIDLEGGLTKPLCKTSIIPDFILNTHPYTHRYVLPSLLIKEASLPGRWRPLEKTTTRLNAENSLLQGVQLPLIHLSLKPCTLKEEEMEDCHSQKYCVF